MNFTPLPHQKQIIDSLYNNSLHQIWCEAGSGKTACVLYNIYQKMLNLEDYKCLIFAPRTSIDLTWPNEIDRWDFMKGFTYSDLRTKQGIEAWKNGTSDIYLLNYDRIKFLKELLLLNKPVNTVYFDEITKMKNPSSMRCKVWNGSHQVEKHNKSLRKNFSNVYGLTGTPALNHLADLYGQVLAIDAGARLGRTKTSFQNKYFDLSFNGFTLTPKENSEKKILDLISDITLSLPPIAGVGVGPLNYVNVEIPLPLEIQKIYKKAQKDFIIKLLDKDIPALTAATLLDKLQQLTSGCIYSYKNNDTENERTNNFIHDCKIEALEKLSKTHDTLLVFYKFKSEESRILSYFPQAEKLNSENDSVERWNHGKIKIFLAHPASTAYSLNLQNGGHNIVWFSLPHSGELYGQANSRLQRMGQKNIVNIYRLLCPRTVDEAIADALRRKESTNNSVKSTVNNLTKISKLS